MKGNSGSVKVVSMVTRAYLGQPINFNELTERLPNFVYEPDQFPALFYRVNDPKITFAIFSSGKIMGYGGRALEDTRRCFGELLKLVEPLLAHPKRVERPEVCMMVASGRIAESLDIFKIAKEVRSTFYEPEQFPGLVWRFAPKEIVILFANGKIVITGPESINRLNEVYAEIVDTLYGDDSRRKD